MFVQCSISWSCPAVGGTSYLHFANLGSTVIDDENRATRVFAVRRKLAGDLRGLVCGGSWFGQWRSVTIPELDTPDDMEEVYRHRRSRNREHQRAASYAATLSSIAKASARPLTDLKDRDLQFASASGFAPTACTACGWSARRCPRAGPCRRWTQCSLMRSEPWGRRGDRGPPGWCARRSQSAARLRDPRSCTVKCRETVGYARGLPGVTGILPENHIDRFAADAEAYEGTREMNTLIVGARPSVAANLRRIHTGKCQFVEESAARELYRGAIAISQRICKSVTADNPLFSCVRVLP